MSSVRESARSAAEPPGSRPWSWTQELPLHVAVLCAVYSREDLLQLAQTPRLRGLIACRLAGAGASVQLRSVSVHANERWQRLSTAVRNGKEKLVFELRPD